MFWEDCNEHTFYKHIWEPDNFLYVNGKNVIYPRVADIVWKYLEQDKQNFDKIRKKLIENKKVFLFVYSSIYPAIYSFFEKRDVDLRNRKSLRNGTTKRNTYKNILMGTSEKVRGLRHLHVLCKESLLRMKLLKGKKKWQMNKNKKRWKKKSKKKKKELRQKIAAKNQELKRIKKSEKEK